jgi:predicted Na+-dependent transporter
MRAGTPVTVSRQARGLITDYPELIAVLAAVVVGLTAARPLSWLATHQAINILLAVLVFVVATTIEPRALRRAAAAWPSLAIAVAAGIVVLPVLAWAVSWIVAPGPLRYGVMTVGLAPCEVASVATTSMAGGDAAMSAGLLIGSTVVTVAAAGPIVGLEAGRATVHTAHIVVNLVLVVALPLAVGLALRASLAVRARPALATHPAPATRPALTARLDRSATVTATVVVAALVAVIASQVRLSARYLLVALALLVFLAASAGLGWLLGWLGSAQRRPAAVAVLLGTSMRDFAIAAALAVAAFGPAAAAPLGLYGILVLAWGTAAAGVLRRRVQGSGG